MNKLFSRIAASALAVTTTVAYMPVSAFITAHADQTTLLDFETSQVALYAKNSIKLNEKSAAVAGSVWSGSSADFTGSSDKFTVTGARASGDDGTDCQLPDFTGLINTAEPYDFEFSGDKTIYDSVLDLTLSSSYTEGDLRVDHAELRGSGRISASGDIDMSIADNSSLTQAMIMSEEGDITINAANLDYSGVIYAPNGKVKINAKNIGLTGAIYADSIEINGTSLTVEYKDFFKINCKAHTESQVFINKRDTLTLSGSVSHDAALPAYRVSSGNGDKVTLTGENTLSPVLSFSEAGEYDITLTASLGNKQSSDTVKVIVTDGPVVNYTTTEDFTSGTLSYSSGDRDELKLASGTASASPVSKEYSLGGESGIKVTGTQSKTAIKSGGDQLDLSYSLEGYGKLITGNGNDVVLCIDNSGSVWSMIPTIKAAALQIIESMGPNDRLGITSLDRLNTPLTDDKDALIAAIETYNLGGGSDYGNGLRIVQNEMFDEESANRNKYIFLLADGENGWDYPNDDEIAMEQAAIFRENGTKVYAFEINPFSYDFRDTSTVQDVAIETNGAYKLCPDADAITKFLLNMADTIYNLAARNVTFTTTVTNKDWIKESNMSKAPDSIVYNDDGSVTLSWNYSTFEIGASDKIDLGLNTGLITGNGYVQVTRDTKLISYDANGEGSVLYLDDITAGTEDYADSGKWTSKVYDSGENGCPWSYVKWTADYYGDSAIDIMLSTSEDGKNFSQPVRVTNGQDLDLKGRYLRTDISMKASSDGETPVLYDLTIYSDEVESSDLRQGADARIMGARNVSEDTPVTLWLDIDGTYDSVSNVKWFIDGTETASPDPLRLTLSFSEAGEHQVSAAVTAGGIETKTAVTMNILPRASLWQEVEQEEFKAVKMTLTETPDYATQYQEPLTFNIEFENPEQVAWVRALYTNPTVWGEGEYRIAYIDEADDYLVSVPLPYNNLAETTIVVDAFDWYGNKTTEQRTIKMDRQQPSVYLNSSRSWVYPENTAELTATASDNDEIASLVLTCNGEEVHIDEEGKYIFSRKEPGDYVFELTAADKAGNQASTSRTVQVREDAGLPYVRINGSTRTILGNSTDFTLTAYDNETALSSLVLTVQKDGEEDITEVLSLSSEDAPIEKENAYTFTPESDGKYIFTLTATDREGNVNSTVLNETVVPDTTAPYITISLSRSEVLAGESSEVTVKVTDDVAVDQIHFFVDGVEKELSEDGTYTYTSDDSDMPDNGIKYAEFKVTAADAAGNERTGSARLKIDLVDTVLPNVSISSSSRFEYRNENAYMTVTASDNIGVAGIKVTVNGEEVQLDENSRYYFDTSEITEYSVTATATDTSGNERTAEKTIVVSDTTRPDIKFTADKSYYDTGDSAVITVDVTDNYQVAKVTADLDGTAVETGDSSFTCTVPDAAAGKYVLTVQAEDVFGNTQERTYTLTIRDTVAPELTASADKERYKHSETPVITCDYSDNVAVTRLAADINGKNLPYDMETGEFTFPDDIVPGEQTVTIRAYDAAGNASEPAVVEFYISSSDDIECPVIESIEVEPEVIRKGDEVTIKIKATDDSGTVILTVQKDGTVIEENAETGTYTFTADELGEITLTVKAEDPSGNYTQSEGKLTVYRNTDNRKIVVDAPTVVKPGEEFTVTITSADGEPFASTELWLGNTDLSAQLSQNSDGSLQTTLSLSSSGNYTFNAVGKDEDGYQSEKLFDVQAAGTYETEIQSEEMQEALKQTPETQPDEEIKALADSFTDPAEAYEYVYNNISFESYTNSRRGAVGAYELKRGNDYDQASLLIGILREMGYPARYATATAQLSIDQAKALIAVNDLDVISRVLGSSGKNAQTWLSQNSVIMEETFVEVYVPASETGETDETLKDLGVWVQLDPSIKASTLSSEEIAAGSSYDMDLPADRERIAGTETAEILDMVEPKVQSMTDLTGDSSLADMYAGAVTVTEAPDEYFCRTIVQKEFNRLPKSLDYTISGDAVSRFNAVPDAKSDRIEFQASNSLSSKYLGVYKISDIYNKRVTLQFEGKRGDKTIFDLSKDEIYRNAFLPVLYIDGEIAAQYTLEDHEDQIGEYIELADEYYFFGDKAWRLGEKCRLTTRINTNGRTTAWNDELTIGSSYSIVFDIGGITESQYDTALTEAAENNGLDISDPANPVVTSDPEKAVTDNNYYDEDKIGSLLNFMGTYYFLNCDAYNSTAASLSNIETGVDTKVLMTEYNIGCYEDTTLGHTTRVIPGRFEIDVSYNSCIGFSRSGDTEARDEFMFKTAYMESFFEGWLWQVLLLNEGASTVAVMDKAMEDGSEIVYLDSTNIDAEIGRVSLESAEEAEIRESVANGYTVIVPAKRVDINQWSGTGYIIADLEDYNHFVFKISGGNNGGSDTENMDLKGEELGERAAAIDLDRAFTGLFTGAQTMYYLLLEFNISSEFSAAVSLLGASSGGGILPAFVGGMALFNAVSHLSDIIGYRVRMLEIFYDYCMAEDTADQVKALKKLMALIIEMTKDCIDTLMGLLEPEGDLIDDVKSGLKDLFGALLDYYGDDEDPETPGDAVEGGMEDDLTDKALEGIVDEIIDAAS